jgi:hypothetical protein
MAVLCWLYTAGRKYEKQDLIVSFGMELFCGALSATHTCTKVKITGLTTSLRLPEVG